MASSLHPVLQHLRRTVLPGDGGPSDGQLLEWFIARRDEEAFAALVRRHGPMVLGVCRRVVGNSHDADDAFQATFLVLVRKAASIVPRELVGNWLHGVAYRTALEARASRARRRARETSVKELPHPMVEPETSRDWQPYLDRELSRLPEKYRVPLVLCDLEGRPRKEVARKLGLPDGTLSSRLATARKLLARRMARYGLSLSGGSLAALLAESAVSASVPAALLSTTIRVSLLTAAGTAAPGLVAAPVAALTKGVMQTMLLIKLRVALVVLVTTGLLTGAGVMLAQPPSPTKTAPHKKDEPPPPALVVNEMLVQDWPQGAQHHNCVACHASTQKATHDVSAPFTIESVDVKRSIVTVSSPSMARQFHPLINYLNLGGTHDSVWLDLEGAQNRRLGNWFWATNPNTAMSGKYKYNILSNNTIVTMSYLRDLLELQVQPTTRILIDGKERKLADLKAGLPVEVDYRPARKSDQKAQAIKIVATGTKSDGQLHEVDLPTGTITVRREDEAKGEVVDTDHAVVKDATITIDGKKGRLEDLKPGMRVVVQHSAIKPVLVGIEAIGPRVEAVLAAVDAPRNTIAVNIRNTHLTAGNVLVAPDAKVVLDGKPASLAELKPGLRVTLQMSAESDRSLVVGITTRKVPRKAP